MFSSWIDTTKKGLMTICTPPSCTWLPQADIDVAGVIKSPGQVFSYSVFAYCKLSIVGRTGNKSTHV